MAFSTAREVFETYVPKRIAGRTELAQSIAAKYEFEVVGESTWTLDFTGPEGKVYEAPSPDASCFIRIDGSAVPGIMQNPMSGLRLLMTGELKIAGEYSLAEHLIKVFRPAAEGE